MTKNKYVVVSGRSSHTVTATTPKEAKEKFTYNFPYAHIKMVAKVRR